MLNKDKNKEIVFIARQPIFKSNLEVVAYELLFRTGDVEHSGVGKEDNVATQQVVINTFTELGLSRVVGEHLAFINLTRQMLLSPLPLPHDRVVIEILETVEPDQEVIDACKRLVKEGFRLALDDFTYRQEMIPLLEICDFVKIDLREHSQKQVVALLKELKKYSLQLIAEKIETNEELEFCKDAGFDFFQGYFLSKPKIVSGKKSSADKLSITRLLAELRNPDNNVVEIEKILASDPKLSFKLLQIINSAAYAKVKKIESIHQAIVYMGLEKLREWGSLIALSAVSSRSPEQMLNAMIRAKMCELLANHIGEQQSSDRYFMVGLFSMLDALLDEELITLLEKINIDQDATKALLQKEGSMGEILKDVLSYENAHWENLDVAKIETGLYRDAYFESISWAMETARTLK